MVCHYEMILYETVGNQENKHEFQRFKIVDVSKIFRIFGLIEMMESFFYSQSQQLYSFQASNLVLGSHYYVSIRGINTYNEMIEGPESHITFETPTCWKMHHFNMSLCREQLIFNKS